MPCRQHPGHVPERLHRLDCAAQVADAAEDPARRQQLSAQDHHRAQSRAQQQGEPPAQGQPDPTIGRAVDQAPQATLPLLQKGERQRQHVDQQAVAADLIGGQHGQGVVIIQPQLHRCGKVPVRLLDIAAGKGAVPVEDGQPRHLPGVGVYPVQIGGIVLYVPDLLLHSPQNLLPLIEIHDGLPADGQLAAFQLLGEVRAEIRGALLRQHLPQLLVVPALGPLIQRALGVDLRQLRLDGVQSSLRLLRPGLLQHRRIEPEEVPPAGVLRHQQDDIGRQQQCQQAQQPPRAQHSFPLAHRACSRRR